MASLLIAVGSVYGGALEVAEAAQAVASSAGYAVEVSEAPSLADLQIASSVLVVTSTTGSGEVPEGLQGLHQSLAAFPAGLAGKSYAVIALGDSSYGETFCAAGRLFDQALQELGLNKLLDSLEIDALEHFQAVEGAHAWIEQWATQLSEKG